MSETLVKMSVLNSICPERQSNWLDLAVTEEALICAAENAVSAMVLLRLKKKIQLRSE